MQLFGKGKKIMKKNITILFTLFILTVNVFAEINIGTRQLFGIGYCHDFPMEEFGKVLTEYNNDVEIITINYNQKLNLLFINEIFSEWIFSTPFGIGLGINYQPINGFILDADGYIKKNNQTTKTHIYQRITFNFQAINIPTYFFYSFNKKIINIKPYIGFNLMFPISIYSGYNQDIVHSDIINFKNKIIPGIMYGCIFDYNINDYTSFEFGIRGINNLAKTTIIGYNNLRQKDELELCYNNSISLSLGIRIKSKKNTNRINKNIETKSPAELLFEKYNKEKEKELEKFQNYKNIAEKFGYFEYMNYIDSVIVEITKITITYDWPTKINKFQQTTNYKEADNIGKILKSYSHQNKINTISESLLNASEIIER